MTIINTDAWPVYKYASRRADELFADYQKVDPGSSKAADLCAQSLAIRQLAIDILDGKHLS